MAKKKKPKIFDIETESRRGVGEWSGPIYTNPLAPPSSRQAALEAREAELEAREQQILHAKRLQRYYGRSSMRDYQQHAWDIIRGFVEGPKEKPTEAKPIAALSGLPAVIERKGFKAELIADTMRLWQESEDMRHCIYKSYLGKMDSGGYVAYHVSPPDNGIKGLCGSGYTLGFEAVVPRGTLNKGPWKFDQIKGKANSNPDSKELRDFMYHVGKELNK